MKVTFPQFNWLGGGQRPTASFQRNGASTDVLVMVVSILFRYSTLPRALRLRVGDGAYLASPDLASPDLDGLEWCTPQGAHPMERKPPLYATCALSGPPAEMTAVRQETSLVPDSE
jgi:hypothetical protein